MIFTTPPCRSLHRLPCRLPDVEPMEGCRGQTERRDQPSEKTGCRPLVCTTEKEHPISAPDAPQYFERPANLVIPGANTPTLMQPKAVTSPQNAEWGFGGGVV